MKYFYTFTSQLYCNQNIQMKHFLILLITIQILFSCQQKSNLQKDFICEVSNLSNTKKVIDIKKKFSIQTPKHWKTNLYYDNIQTQIYTADTTKQLSETYILDIALNSGELILDDSFKNKVIENLHATKLQNLKFKFDTFKEKPSLWFVSKGKKRDLDYYYFQLFILNSPTDYYEITTKIYGNEHLDTRLCESIAIISKIEFLNNISY